MQAHTTKSSDGRAIIVLVDEDGDIATINESHPNYLRIAAAVDRGEDPSEWMVSSTDWFATEYLDAPDESDDICDICEAYNDECECDDPDYDREVVESLAETIARYRREGRDATNLVKFMHRLEANPSRRSREQLFTWTQAKDLTIDADGYIVGFKGVRYRDARTQGVSDLLPLDRYPYQSSNSGHGVIDGIEVTNAPLPMGVGAVITIPRNEVQDDPTIGCHVGLHVGTHSYASSFAPVLVEVRFDPADVVSVPSDCGFQKLRCCRYEVIAIHDLDDDDLSAHEPEATSTDDFDEQEAFDQFVADAPLGWRDALKARIFGRGK